MVHDRAHGEHAVCTCNTPSPSPGRMPALWGRAGRPTQKKKKGTTTQAAPTALSPARRKTAVPPVPSPMREQDPGHPGLTPWPPSHCPAQIWSAVTGRLVVTCRGSLAEINDLAVNVRRCANGARDVFELWKGSRGHAVLGGAGVNPSYPLLLTALQGSVDVAGPLTANNNATVHNNLELTEGTADVLGAPCP